MNAKTNTTNTPAKRVLIFEPARLENLTNHHGLSSLYDAMLACSEALLGCKNRPNCLNPADDAYNVVGDILDELEEFFDASISELAAWCAELRCDDPGLAEVAAWTVLRARARYNDDLTDFVAFAAKVAADFANIKRATAVSGKS